MFIRQIVLAAKDLEPVLLDLSRVLGIEISIRDPGPGLAAFGLVNAVMPVGNTFLEVVSPQEENTAAGRYLDRRKGDGGYMVIFQTHDLESDKKRFEELGIRTVWKADLDDVSSVHLHPKDTGGAIVSVDQPNPPESWRWAGAEWQKKVHTDVTQGIVGLEVQSKDPGALAARWSRMLDISSKQENDSSFRMNFEKDHIVKIVPDSDGRGEGISGFEVLVKDEAAFLDRAKELGYSIDRSGVRVAGITIRPRGQ